MLSPLKIYIYMYKNEKKSNQHFKSSSQHFELILFPDIMFMVFNDANKLFFSLAIFFSSFPINFKVILIGYLMMAEFFFYCARFLRNV